MTAKTLSLLEAAAVNFVKHAASNNSSAYIRENGLHGEASPWAELVDAAALSASAQEVERIEGAEIVGELRGEVERLRFAIKETIADASYHLQKYRPHVLEILKAALSAPRLTHEVERPAVSSIDFHQKHPRPNVCTTCDGAGELVIWGAKVVSGACPDCAGTGISAPRPAQPKGPTE